MTTAEQNDCKTLWMGAIQTHWDEQFLFNLYAEAVQPGELVRVKLPRHSISRLPLGYAFIEFRTHESASYILESYNGKPIPGTFVVFRLNWGAGGRPEAKGEEYSIFVGDLSPLVTESTLENVFKLKYPSCSSAKVITDPLTGQSKGFGFVRFTNEEECCDARNTMNGVVIGSRPIRVGEATARRQEIQTGTPLADYPSLTHASQQYRTGYTQAGQTHSIYQLHQHLSNLDLNNSTVFVGNLDDSIDDVRLRQHFERCGEILSVRIPANKKGCGFVKFSDRATAEQAISSMHGTLLGTSRIRLDWGKAGNGRNSTAHIMNSPQQAVQNYIFWPQPQPSPQQIYQQQLLHHHHQQQQQLRQYYAMYGQTQMYYAAVPQQHPQGQAVFIHQRSAPPNVRHHIRQPQHLAQSHVVNLNPTGDIKTPGLNQESTSVQLNEHANAKEDNFKYDNIEESKLNNRLELEQKSTNSIETFPATVNSDDFEEPKEEQSTEQNPESSENSLNSQTQEELLNHADERAEVKATKET